MSDPGAWVLVEEKGKEIKGYMVTYVGDVMIMAESALGAKWIKAIKHFWETSTPECCPQSLREAYTRKL